MTTFATLGIEFTSRTAAKAAADMDKVESAAEGAERAVEDLSKANEKLDSSSGKATAGAKKVTDALDKQAKGSKKATDELDRIVGVTGRTIDVQGRLAPAVKRATDAIDKIPSGAKRATDDLTRMHSAAELLGTVLGKLAALVGAAFGINALKNMADSWSDMRSTLGAAIGDMDAASGMMNRMLEIAQTSYSPLNQTVQMYARNVAVLRDLGKSTGQTADFTEALNHMLVITATKGERAASVQDALSKAMATGRLQADGLETVLANGGRVAQALADELGTNVSGLRDFASQGKITGQIIADAIIKPLDDVREIAGSMDATVADGFTKVGNSLLALVGNFDQASGASLWFATQLDAISQWLTAVSQTDFVAWAKTATGAIKLLGQAIIALGTGYAVTALFALIATIKAVGVTFMAQYYILAPAMTALTAGARGLAAALALVGGPIGLIAAAAAGLGLALWNTSGRAAAAEEALGGLREAQDALSDSVTRFYDDMSQKSLERMISDARLAVEALGDVLAELIKPSWTTTMEREAQLLFNTTNAVRAEITGLVRELQNGELSLDEHLSAMERLEALIIQATGGLINMNKEQRTFYDNLVAPIELLRKTLEGQKVAIEEAATGVKALTTEQQKALDTAQDMIKSYERKLELSRIERLHGKDSLHYLGAQLAQERAILRARVDAMDILDDTRRSIMAAYDASVAMENVTRYWQGAVEIVRTQLDLARQALVMMAVSEPGPGWLDIAIQKASTLALRLWDAAAAALAAATSGGVDPVSQVIRPGSGGPVGTLTRDIDKLGKSAGGARKEVDELTDAAKKWQDRIKEARTPLEKYNEELAELAKLQKAGKLSTDEVAKATDILVGELADATPMVGDLADAWGDFVSNGFRDFKGFVSSILSSFKSMISEMIATAARNKIMIGMGVTGGGVAGTAASAGTGGAGGGGLFSNILGFGGSIMSGASGLATSLFGAGGGISAAGTYLSSVLGTATTSFAAFGAAIGAVVPVIGVIAGLASLGKKLFGRELKDTGLQGTFSDDGFEGNSYKFYKGGLFRSNKTTRGAVDDATASMLSGAYDSLRGSVVDMAASLGIGAEAIQGFTHSFKFSTKGLSEDEAAQKLQDAMQEAGNGLAALILGIDGLVDSGERAGGALNTLDELRIRLGRDTAPVLTEAAEVVDAVADAASQAILDMMRPGEGALDLLTRLATSLATVNGTLGFFGRGLMEISLASADAASSLIDAVGGLDAWTSLHDRYLAAFFSAEEQLEMVTRQMEASFVSIGASLPETHSAFRAMVEAQDLATEAGRDMYASLMMLAPAYDEMRKLAISVEAAEQQRLDALRQQEEALAAVTARERDAIANERYRLETQLLQIQGDAVGLRTRELALLYEVNRPLQEHIWALQDEADAATKAAAAIEDLRRSLQDMASVALDDLRKAVDAEKSMSQAQLDADLFLIETQRQTGRERIDLFRSELEQTIALTREGVDARIAALKEEADAQRLMVSAARAALSAAESGISGMRFSTPALDLMRRSAAEVELARMARASSVDADSIGRVMSALRPDTSIFGSEEDFLRSSARNLHLAEQVRSTAARQLTTEERVLAQLEQSSADLQAQGSLQIELYQSQIEQASSQFDDRMAALDEQEAALRGRHSDLVLALDRQLAQTETGVEIALGTWRATLSVADAVSGVEAAIYAITQSGLFSPAEGSVAGAVASGTVFSAPPAAAAPYSSQPLGNPSELTREEVRDLKEMLQGYLRAISTSTSQAARTLRDWDDDGLPREREGS